MTNFVAGIMLGFSIGIAVAFAAMIVHRRHRDRL